MKKRRRYQMLSSITEAGLSEQVEKYLSEGWDLYGQPFGDTYDDKPWLYQAVIKTEEVPS